MTAEKGDELPCGRVSFSVLWPEKNAAGKDVNEEAMVMKLSFGEFRMLFTGAGSGRNSLDMGFSHRPPT